MKVVDLRGNLPTHRTLKYKTRKLSDIRSIAIHHSLTLSGSPEAFANYHINTNDWPGIAYTYVVQRDGTVYKCWDHDKVTYHVGNSNKHALGICMVGDFRTQQPTVEQYGAAIELVRQLQKEIPTATQVKGHSEYPGYSWKACPVISMDAFRSSVFNINIVEKGDEPMTPAEKMAFDALVAEVAGLKNSKEVLKRGMQQQGSTIKKQTARIAELERLQKMDVPSWAKEAVDAAYEAGLISSPTGGSYDLYRMLTVMHRGGLITKRKEGVK